MVGSFRYAFLHGTNNVYDELVKPAKAVIDRYLKGPARMENSMWKNSLCLSECYLERGDWHFKTLIPDNDSNSAQTSLFT